jgi:hypothetical protein
LGKVVPGGLRPGYPSPYKPMQAEPGLEVEGQAQ